MEDKFVQITYNDVELEGEILLVREKFVVVEILKPFCNYSSYLYLFPEDPSSKHFFENHKEYAKELLIVLYKKLTWLDERIERISLKHDLYVEEMKALKVVENLEVKKRIECKLQEAFFNYIFSPLDFRFSIQEKSRIMSILEIYKLVNYKIYIT